MIWNWELFSGVWQFTPVWNNFLTLIFLGVYSICICWYMWIKQGSRCWKPPQRSFSFPTISQQNGFWLEGIQELPKDFSQAFLAHSITCILELYHCKEIFPLEPCTPHCLPLYRNTGTRFNICFTMDATFFSYELNLYTLLKFLFSPYTWLLSPHQSFLSRFPLDISFPYHCFKAVCPSSQYLYQLTQFLHHIHHLSH